MRTTLDVDEDVMAAARSLAAERGTSIGTALSELARKGLRGGRPAEEDGLPVFAVEGDAPTITPEMVREAAEES